MTSLAQGMVGLAIVCALALLCTRQVGAARVLSVAQGLACCLALSVQAQPLTALGLLIGALWLPYQLGHVAEVGRLAKPQGGASGVAGGLVAGAGLTLLTMGLDRSGLPFALVLIGLLLLATRTCPAIRVLALLTMQNGTALAVAGTQTITWPIGLAAGVPVVPGLALWAVWAVARQPGARSA